MHDTSPLKEKVNVIAHHVIDRLITRHVRDCAIIPISYDFKEHFERRSAEELFENAVDHLIPEAHDVINTLVPIPDVTLDGRASKNKGIKHLVIKWWNVDTITIEGEMEVSPFRKTIAAARFERLEALEARGTTYLDLLSEIERMQIPAYGPLCLQNSHGDETSTRYSGRAYVPEGFEWPTDSSGNAMKFLAQFREDQFPRQVQEDYALGDGLISVFTSHKTLDDEVFNPEQSSQDFQVFRFLLSAKGTLIDPPDGDVTPAMTVHGWKEVKDTPSWPDLLSGELTLPDRVLNTLDCVNDGVLGAVEPRRIGVSVDQSDEAFVARNVEYFWGVGSLPPTAAFRGASLETFAENKLCGWPQWQGERRWMTHNGQRMFPLLQIAVGDGILANMGIDAVRTAHLFIDAASHTLKVTPWTLSAIR
jgi:hypothetical protein